MRKIVKAISRKDMPSQWGGTWQIVKVKFVDTGDQIFELQGFSKQEKENLKPGEEIAGYVSQRSWNGKNGQVITDTFNKITAEYVYGLLLKLKPDIESIPEKKVGTTEDNWEGGETVDTPQEDNLWQEGEGNPNF